MSERILPTGFCWCGCGAETKNVGSFFLQGHDKAAVAAVIAEKYGSTIAFLLAHRGPVAPRTGGVLRCEQCDKIATHFTIDGADSKTVCQAYTNCVRL